MSEPVFKALVSNYVECLEQRVFFDGDIWTVADYELRLNDGKVFCACGYYEKCGIPCSHMIKIIIEIREDIFNYVHERWKITVAKSTSPLRIPRGRPRDSRRQ